MNIAAPEAKLSPRFLSGVGGALYLAIIAIGLFCEMGVRNSVIAGDAAATAANLKSMESLWRLGVASELVLLMCAVPLTLILFILLKPVSKHVATLILLFGAVTLSVEAANTLNFISVLFPLGKASSLAAFEPNQLHAMASLSIRMFNHGFGIALVFFGCECLVLGYLIFKSGFLPKIVGVLMTLAGLSYLINTFAMILSPSLANLLYPAVLIPAFIGESSLCLWLLFKGVNVERWNARASNAAVLN